MVMGESASDCGDTFLMVFSTYTGESGILLFFRTISSFVLLRIPGYCMFVHPSAGVLHSLSSISFGFVLLTTSRTQITFHSAHTRSIPFHPSHNSRSCHLPGLTILFSLSCQNFMPISCAISICRTGKMHRQLSRKYVEIRHPRL